MQLYFSKALPDVEAIVQSKALSQILAGEFGGNLTFSLHCAHVRALFAGWFEYLR